MFRVKICGLRTSTDLQAAVLAGADAVGLNFYPQSKRYLDPSLASVIVSEIPSSVTRVGLFVNSPADHILHLANLLSLHVLQLHGDEPPELLQELRGWNILRAFRCSRPDFEEIDTYLDACRSLDCLPWAVLLDGFSSHQYGGTGQTADWHLASTWPHRPDRPPLVLAGGLTPSNVSQAIRTVRPWAVDTASGVELSPGIKSADLMQQFVSNASQAFAAEK